MKLLKLLLIVVGIIATSACSDSTKENFSVGDANYHHTKNFYNNIVSGRSVDVAKLNLFFTQMPKGGDLHHHYTGSIYAETYLGWVEGKGWFIDKCTLRILKSDTKATASCPALTVSELLKENASYRKLLSLWSDKDFKNHFHAEFAPDANFFNTFSYFSPVSHENMRVGLLLLKKRAIDENVSYIETMFSRVGVESKGSCNNEYMSKSYFTAAEIEAFNQDLRKAASHGENPQKEVNLVLDKIVAAFGKCSNFSSGIDAFVNKLETLHKGIDDEGFTMRFQTYAARVLDPLQVFTDLYSGYLAAKKSPLIVGVNIVAPENNHVALADYTLHMRMFNYLLEKYPNVNRALHAGELALGMVRPRNLNFHIGEARSIAKAQRIGHGVDIPFEIDALNLLKDLKENAAIEINLTSNEFILGVEGNAHPYQIYASYGVPVVISTDDSGVSRNNLSNEYMLLASRYKPSYADIKKYVYNSIRYSFLNPEDKARNVTILDARFKRFEKDMASLAEVEASKPR